MPAKKKQKRAKSARVAPKKARAKRASPARKATARRALANKARARKASTHKASAAKARAEEQQDGKDAGEEVAEKGPPAGDGPPRLRPRDGRSGRGALLAEDAPARRPRHLGRHDHRGSRRGDHGAARQRRADRLPSRPFRRARPRRSATEPRRGLRLGGRRVRDPPPGGAGRRDAAPALRQAEGGDRCRGRALSPAAEAGRLVSSPGRRQPIGSTRSAPGSLSTCWPCSWTRVARWSASRWRA